MVSQKTISNVPAAMPMLVSTSGINNSFCFGWKIARIRNTIVTKTKPAKTYRNVICNLVNSLHDLHPYRPFFNVWENCQRILRRSNRRCQESCEERKVKWRNDIVGSDLCDCPKKGRTYRFALTSAHLGQKNLAKTLDEQAKAYQRLDDMILARRISSSC